MKFRFDVADVKVTIQSFLIVGIMASLFILGEKILWNKFKLPGVEAVNAI